MLKRNMRDLLPAFAGVLILVANFMISKDLLARAWPQKPQKIVSKEDLGNPNQAPIEVTDVKLGAHAVSLSEPFDGDEEWIRNISFKLKNRSTKNITYVGANLVFSDTTTSDPSMVRQLRFGRKPNQPNLTNDEMLLKPGDFVNFSISTQYESLKKFIEAKKQLKNIDKVVVSVYLVIFDNGMKWDVGNFYVPDSTEPSGFRRIAAPVDIIK